MIQITPVEKIKSPGYPNRNEVSRDRGILLAHPVRWRSKTMAAALAALVPLAASGCSAETADPSNTDGSGNTPEPTDSIKTDIPLFDHGEGYGSFGCVSIVPPAFITEAEASELFSQVALEYGLSFTEGKEIKIGRVETSLYPYDGENAVDAVNGKMQLSLDGYNNSLELAYEFISVDDVKELETESEGIYASVDSYAVKDTAAMILDEINNEESAPNTAVFYDPCLSYTDVADKDEIQEMDFDEYTELAKQANMQQLEQQIRDFFEWLQGEGII